VHSRCGACPASVPTELSACLKGSPTPCPASVPTELSACLKGSPTPCRAGARVATAARRPDPQRHPAPAQGGGWQLAALPHLCHPVVRARQVGAVCLPCCHACQTGGGGVPALLSCMPLRPARLLHAHVGIIHLLAHWRRLPCDARGYALVAAAWQAAHPAGAGGGTHAGQGGRQARPPPSAPCCRCGCGCSGGTCDPFCSCIMHHRRVRGGSARSLGDGCS